MEDLKTIVQGTTAKIISVYNGKVTYSIQTELHTYYLEIDSCDEEWKATSLDSEIKSITLMRWIRKGIKNQDGTFIMVK
jgi:hypothetical protein